MKRFLALLLCLILVIPAFAEVSVPEAFPPQDELQNSFFSNLSGFFNSDFGSLSVTAAEGDQQIFTATAGSTDDGVFDINGFFSSMPVHLQFTEDTAYVSLDGQLYKLPYSSIAQLASQLTGVEVNAPVMIDQQAVINLFNIVINDDILPATSFKFTDEGIHTAFDLNAEGLIKLGGKLLEDSQIRMIIAYIVPDLDATWAQVRNGLATGEIPFSIHSDMVIGEKTALEATADILGMQGSLSATVAGSAVDFSLAVGDVAANGKADPSTFELHCTDRNGAALDLTCNPDNHHIDFKAGLTSFTADLSETAEAIDISFACTQPDYAGASQTTDGSAHIDKATRLMNGVIHLSDGTVIDINGAPENESYHTHLDVSQNGTVYFTADCLYTNTDHVLAISFSAAQGEETVLTANVANAKETGAFTLQYDMSDGTHVDGRGVCRKGLVYGDLTVSQEGTVYTKVDYSYENNENRFTVSVNTDALMSDTMERVMEIYADYDKNTGSYTGTYWIPGNNQRTEVQGQINDHMFRVKGMATLLGNIDLTVYRNDDSVIGNLNGIFYNYGTCNGSLLWSPSAKSLALTTQAFRLNASLVQDVTGIPVDIRLMYQEMMRYKSWDVKANRNGIYYNETGKVTTVNWKALDEHTIRIDMAQDVRRYESGAHVIITLYVDDHALKAEVTDGDGAKLFEMSAVETDAFEIEPMSDREDAVEITPELLSELVAMIEETTQDAPDAAVEEDTGSYEDGAYEDDANASEDAVAIEAGESSTD